jgi:hypothetical protein
MRAHVAGNSKTGEHSFSCSPNIAQSERLTRLARFDHLGRDLLDENGDSLRANRRATVRCEERGIADPSTLFGAARLREPPLSRALHEHAVGVALPCHRTASAPQLTDPHALAELAIAARDVDRPGGRTAARRPFSPPSPKHPAVSGMQRVRLRSDHALALDKPRQRTNACDGVCVDSERPEREGRRRVCLRSDGKRIGRPQIAAKLRGGPALPRLDNGADQAHELIN